MERESREARGEQFSFHRFISLYRESKKAPFIIHDEATFEKFLEDEMNSKYVRGPKSSRRPETGRENYRTRYKKEILDPFLYELKRKAHITHLIRVCNRRWILGQPESEEWITLCKVLPSNLKSLPTILTFCVDLDIFSYRLKCFEL